MELQIKITATLLEGDRVAIEKQIEAYVEDFLESKINGLAEKSEDDRTISWYEVEVNK